VDVGGSSACRHKRFVKTWILDLYAVFLHGLLVIYHAQKLLELRIQWTRLDRPVQWAGG
jgi:hypothetical protein